MKNVINNHLDKLDDIKDDIKTDVNKLFDKKIVKQIIKEPIKTVDMLADEFIKILIARYSQKVLKESRRYIKDVESENKEEV